MDARARIKALAGDLGFQTVRFACAGRSPDAAHLESWLSDGMHADMDWLSRTADVRVDPRVRMAEARTVVVLGLGHAWNRPPHPGGRAGLVARYAWGRDYHNLIGKRLKKLRQALRDAGIESFGGVDTAPVLERSWAVASGAGALGKNAVVFQPGRSSWGFLAALVIDAEVEPDAPYARDPCGTCSRCLVACPTGAFSGPHRLDARRCISYWTIEARELAPEALLPGFGAWVFGCDVCQEVCPHNHHPPDPTEPDFLPKNAWLDLDEVLATPDDALMERFLGTPLRRPGAAGLKRNAAVALGNLGDRGAIETLERWGLAHEAPVVRDASRWAVARLAP
ncbi:MAG: tRNA epoxyqueuosine(34) reductase QueG [Alphaproteobacteria bacterium]|nr:tRNA epoxyqueuosine(34) reductase QueG [Alphaproteobacteria bacterium]